MTRLELDWPRGAFRTEEEILAYGEGKNSFVCYLVDRGFTPNIIRKLIVTPPWFRRMSPKPIPMHDNLGGYFPELIDQKGVYMFPNYCDAFAYACKLKERGSKMCEWPRGAVKSKEELLKFCEKQNGKPFHYYLFIPHNNSIEKRRVIAPYIKESQLGDSRLFLNDTWGRYLDSLGLVTGKEPVTSFMFLNYWDAFAHACRLKEKANAKVS